VRLPGTALLVADLLPDDDPQKPVVVSLQGDAYRGKGDRQAGLAPSAAMPMTRCADPDRCRHQARRHQPSPSAIRDARSRRPRAFVGTDRQRYTYHGRGSPGPRPDRLPHAGQIQDGKGGWTIVE
jgi:hypothetical protein